MLRIQLFVSKTVSETAAGKPLADLLARLIGPVDGCPDVIHFVGFDNNTVRKAHQASKHLIPYIFTPLGTLQPWSRTRRLPRKYGLTAFHARKLLKTASCVHACSVVEGDFLRQDFGAGQIEIIQNPLVTGCIDEDFFINSIYKLYEDALEASEGRIWEACRKETEAFIEQKNKEDVDLNTIGDILLKLQYAKKQLRQGRIYERTIKELATTIVAADYDESLMAQYLKELRLDTFMARIESLMLHRGFISEGFLPIPAIDDRASKKIPIIQT